MPYEGLERKLYMIFQSKNRCVLIYSTQVKREVRMNEKAELYIEPILTRYENPDIPEQFLVVRT
jgi:hypothetical protein